MSKPRDDRQVELFRPALKQIIDLLGHPLVRLTADLDLEKRFGVGFRSVAGPAAVADAEDRWTVDPQAHAQSVRRRATGNFTGDQNTSAEE